MAGRIALACALLAVMALVGPFGCGPGRSGKLTRSQAGRGGVVPPARVTTRGLSVRWRRQVPGKAAEPLLDLDAVSGSMESSTQSGVFSTTTGILYDGGLPRASFVAPVVRAQQMNQVVEAQGGVQIKSIAPEGTTITADRVVWRASSDEIVAVGNVRFVHQPPHSARPLASGGPFDRVTVNTTLKKVRIP